jgi:two-component system sensor histidine kinase UhpB
MSLRYQINIKILFSSLFILVLGGYVAIWQARHSVNKEVESSINLAVQLITFGFAQASSIPYQQTDWLSQLKALKEIRHLNIQLQEPSGQILTSFPDYHAHSDQEIPPLWFINLVEGSHAKAEYPITAFNGKPLVLLIQANSLDEITEVWQETLAFLGSLFLLTLLTFLTVHLAFNKALKSITSIVNALKSVETGQYQQKLPEFSIREYDSIAKAINHMMDELNETYRENRALTRHTLEIQEDERQRLSQELHDELGQSLTAIKVMAVTAAREQADIKKTTEAIMGICDHLMGVVRLMMHQLHPLVLTDLGLKAALEDLSGHWSTRYPDLRFILNCSDKVNALDQKTAIQVFRVIQECLTNVVRHAQARQVIILLEIADQAATRTLRLQVTDDGRGCSSDSLKTGFGLLGMKERINTLGGEFIIKTQPQQGMSIIASIHLP